MAIQGNAKERASSTNQQLRGRFYEWLLKRGAKCTLIMTCNYTKHRVSLISLEYWFLRWKTVTKGPLFTILNRIFVSYIKSYWQFYSLGVYNVVCGYLDVDLLRDHCHEFVLPTMFNSKIFLLSTTNLFITYWLCSRCVLSYKPASLLLTTRM